jgi:hypothetical protein
MIKRDPINSSILRVITWGDAKAKIPKRKRAIPSKR